MRDGDADTAALAERYLDFWERWVQAATETAAESWRFDARAAMVSAARLGAVGGHAPGASSDDPDETRT
ncbi:MAG: hypothetical protein QF893_12440 [Alphaproteobacteria bacterium]|jgi:hypothetical protein|nr:hypothetical protein [Alphaproteobacteria bacterium]